MATRTAVLQPKSIKLQWVMSPERVPRELPEGEEAVEWQLQLEASPVPIRVTFSAADYRRLVRELEARGDSMVTLDGFLVGGGGGSLALERVRFKVDRRRGGGGPAKP